MNVDVLSDNPSWRWYPLIGGVLLLLTVAVWLSSKFTNVRVSGPVWTFTSLTFTD